MGDYNIRMQFDLAADLSAVRQVLTTQDGITSWWSSQSTLDRNARRLLVRFPDQPQPFEFDVREGDGRIDWVTGGFPPWWAGTTVRWRIGPNPDAAGTRLMFEHRDYDPDNPVIPIVTPAWALIIQRLKGLVETGTRQPFFDF
jgi:hypothetical protein